MLKLDGKAFVIVGGQWGSEGKGAAAAWFAKHVVEATGKGFDYHTTNAGAQAGHTSVHNGKKRVVFHLPTAPLIERDLTGQMGHIFLNGGAIIEPAVFLREVQEQGLSYAKVSIHPRAAVITAECREAEGRDDSAQTKIASTRKGVGEALARKVLRSGVIAREHPDLYDWCGEPDLNRYMGLGSSVLVEVPQGIDLSVNGAFYPHCTSRNCTVQQGLADADIHPSFYGGSMLVLRTFPIRVGNIQDGNGNEIGNSGGVYPDQREMSWGELGQTPEITTVTKRVRRVFSFSDMQMRNAMALTRPAIVYLTFVDYAEKMGISAGWYVDRIIKAARDLRMSPPRFVMQHGPTTDDVDDKGMGMGASR